MAEDCPSFKEVGEAIQDALRTVEAKYPAYRITLKTPEIRMDRRDESSRLSAGPLPGYQRGAQKAGFGEKDN